MQKMYAVIRTVGEITLSSCEAKLKEREIDYCILKDLKPLELASKETIKKGMELEYEWIMTVDADLLVTMSKKELEDYCEDMKNLHNDKIFSFTGYINCTRRGIVHGIHFFRTRYCKQVYNYVKDKDYGFHRGREEWEICQTAKNELGLGGPNGEWEIEMAVHRFDTPRI